MIPEAYIRAWYEQAPWQAWSMVEQDLILSRTLVDLFHSRLLADSLILRGGTVLHKLFFPRALRYSEDIDLVQRAAGPIGPVFDEIRGVLRDWLGEPKRKIGPDVATLTYRVASEDVPPFPLRIKVEINTREHFQVWPIEQRAVEVESRWFKGCANVPVYQVDELLATKLRALYQRRKGRDLFDLAAALRSLDASPDRILHTFRRYMAEERHPVTGRELRTNLLEKLEHPGFKADCGPLLRPDIESDISADFELVDHALISRMDIGH